MDATAPRKPDASAEPSSGPPGPRASGSSSPSSSRSPALYEPVLNDPGHLLGAGADARVRLGNLLEILTAVANITTAVAPFPILERQSEGIALGYASPSASSSRPSS